MKKLDFPLCLLLFAILPTAISATKVVDIETERQKRISLFNVVTFENDVCQTNDAVNGNQFRSGTCLTSTECNSRGGGRAAGSCAAGFGICCLFALDTCGATVTENCTYVRNPGFDGTFDGDPGTCNFIVQRCADDVCQLKLEFLSFMIQGPNDAAEATGGACNLDTFTVDAPNSDMLVPVICGINTGQHMFVELDRMTAQATLEFNFMMDGARQWEIKVSQFGCYDENRAPEGCLQYFTGCQGMIMTFNYEGMGTNLQGSMMHLANQCYSSCIRQEEGMCCVKYSVCEEADNSGFTFDTFRDGALAGGPLPAALIESQCTEDFIIIEGSDTECCLTRTTNRYCGERLNSITGNFDGTGTMVTMAARENREICDCTPPFMVTFNTDNTADPVGGAPPAQNNPLAAVLGRGVCLKYTQVPCGTIA